MHELLWILSHSEIDWKCSSHKPRLNLIEELDEENLKISIEKLVNYSESFILFFIECSKKVLITNGNFKTIEPPSPQSVLDYPTHRVMNV